MEELDIKVGFQCNNRCVFCLNKDKKNLKTFSYTELKKQIEKFCEKNTLEKLIISGGEPLIYKDLFKILDFAKSKGVKRFEIQTNGRMLAYENLVKKIGNYKPVGFLVSLHFSKKELYKKYMQVDGFDQVIRGINNLRNHNFNPTINTVVMNQNLNDLENIIKLLIKNNIKKTQYRYIDGKNVNDKYNTFVPKYSESIPIIKNIVNKYSEKINIKLREIPLCLLGENYKRFLAPHNSNRLNATTTNKLIPNNKVEEQQFIYPKCGNCSYKKVCSGVRKEYINHYEAPDIKPI
ncbi:MAG: radical SAM protein [Candidatus Woesearchaeota archaeon]